MHHSTSNQQGKSLFEFRRKVFDSLKSLLCSGLIYALNLVFILLFAMMVLSWAICPDCPLESNSTAIWTHQTLAGFFEPTLALVRPILPFGGFIETENSPVQIDYSPGIIATLLSAVSLGVARFRNR